jgi:aspartokinase
MSTTDALVALRNRRPAAAPQINIGQLAIGDIHNVDMLVLLDAAEARLDSVDASPEAREESRKVIQRMRDVLTSVGPQVVSETLAAALRSVLGLP